MTVNLQISSGIDEKSCGMKLFMLFSLNRVFTKTGTMMNMDTMKPLLIGLPYSFQS